MHLQSPLFENWSPLRFFWRLCQLFLNDNDELKEKRCERLVLQAVHEENRKLLLSTNYAGRTGGTA